MLYDFGGICVKYNGIDKYFTERSRDFKFPDLQENYNIDIEIDNEIIDYITIPDGDVIASDKSTWLRKRGDKKGYYFYSPSKDKDNVLILVDASEDWSKAKIFSKKSDVILPENICKEPTTWNDFHIFLSAGTVYRNHLVRKNGILIHCSSIEYKGKGLIFSAPSGTGKSTHTRLWKELYGDDVKYINDDRPAVRFFGNIPFVCGTPWSGKTNLFTNSKVPLCYIFLLEQSEYNTITRLDNEKALQMLLPRCFLPYFDINMIKEAMDTLENILKVVPVYLLKCKPDYKAVEMVSKCMN